MSKTGNNKMVEDIYYTEVIKLNKYKMLLIAHVEINSEA